MPAQKTQGKKGSRKIGRNTEKCKKYRMLHTREKNKLARIRRSNGHEAAIAYATRHELLGWYQRTYPEAS